MVEYLLGAIIVLLLMIFVALYNNNVDALRRHQALMELLSNVLRALKEKRP